MRLSCFTLLFIGSFAVATTAANSVSSRQNLPTEHTEASNPKELVSDGLKMLLRKEQMRPPSICKSRPLTPYSLVLKPGIHLSV